MSKTITLFQFLLQMTAAGAKWFHRTTIAPDNGGQPLPPIRYDGDPTEIYLA